ncbi:hypothetical protein PM082_022975 [Marasmius tenuissimus]|nr:hypothetical protein PM082_022975 [Marasmius tenuissimus]
MAKLVKIGIMKGNGDRLRQQRTLTCTPSEPIKEVDCALSTTRAELATPKHNGVGSEGSSHISGRKVEIAAFVTRIFVSLKCRSFFTRRPADYSMPTLDPESRNVREKRFESTLDASHQFKAH